MSRAITTGNVGASGRARKLVAPNSPNATTYPNPAAATRDRPTSGRSTSRHTRAGEAPNVAAACRSRSSTARNTGSTIRTINGVTTSACASGTSNGDVRKSPGNASIVTRYPKPTVTADTPSGSINAVSSTSAIRLPDRRNPTSTTAENTPTTRATVVASNAVRTELKAASSPVTANVPRSPRVASAAYP